MGSSTGSVGSDISTSDRIAQQMDRLGMDQPAAGSKTRTSDPPHSAFFKKTSAQAAHSVERNPKGIKKMLGFLGGLKSSKEASSKGIDFKKIQIPQGGLVRDTKAPVISSLPLPTVQRAGQSEASASVGRRAVSHDLGVAPREPASLAVGANRQARLQSADSILFANRKIPPVQEQHVNYAKALLSSNGLTAEALSSPDLQKSVVTQMFLTDSFWLSEMSDFFPSARSAENNVSDRVKAYTEAVVKRAI
ncbi:MAG: hypothetical protein R3194_04235 [Limnobacter sp.]|nr:hypothetical protein [Limnobacter sp.]